MQEQDNKNTVRYGTKKPEKESLSERVLKYLGAGLVGSIVGFGASSAAVCYEYKDVSGLAALGAGDDLLTYSGIGIPIGFCLGAIGYYIKDKKNRK